MLHTDVSDEADSDLSLNRSGCGSSDQSHDLFLQPNYKAACTLVIPTKPEKTKIKRNIGTCSSINVQRNLHR